MHYAQPLKSEIFVVYILHRFVVRLLSFTLTVVQYTKNNLFVKLDGWNGCKNSFNGYLEKYLAVKKTYKIF